MKKWKKYIVILLLIIISISIVSIIYINFYKTYKEAMLTNVSELDKVLTKEEALEDIDYMIKMLEETHPAWLEEESDLPKLVQQQYKAVVAELSDTTTLVKLWQASASILNVMHDAHSSVSYSFGENFYTVKDESLFKDAKIISIDKIPFEDVISNFKKYSSYEMEESPEYTFLKEKLYLHEGFLRLVGINTADGVDYKIEKDGTIKTYHITMIPYSETNHHISSADRGDTSFVHYKIDKEKNIGVFTLTSCKVNDEYINTLDSFFNEIFKNNIQNVIIDLRNNGGGNSGVANCFMEYVDVDKYYSFGEKYYREEDALLKMYYSEKNVKKSQTFNGKIYVLTSIKTFSAATDFAAMVADNHLGIIVGETSSNNPTCYIDSKHFQMPNSQLDLYISFKHQYRIDKSKIGEFLIPDYEIEEDKALMKAYELILMDK